MTTIPKGHIRKCDNCNKPAFIALIDLHYGALGTSEDVGILKDGKIIGTLLVGDFVFCKHCAKTVNLFDMNKWKENEM